jgi:hypothetical protein
MRSQFTGNFVLKWKEVGKTERRTKDDTRKYVDRQKKEISDVVIEFAT